MAPSAKPFFLVAVVFSILYTNWRCMKLADVVLVGGRPDFIMAKLGQLLCDGGIGPRKAVVCAGL
jgi:hypothetical protein